MLVLVLLAILLPLWMTEILHHVGCIKPREREREREKRREREREGEKRRERERGRKKARWEVR